MAILGGVYQSIQDPPFPNRNMRSMLKKNQASSVITPSKNIKSSSPSLRIPKQLINTWLLVLPVVPDVVVGPIKVSAIHQAAGTTREDKST